MTTERTIRALEDAVYDARQTMDDLVSKVEDLEIENQRLREELDACDEDRAGG